jgi:hypothetical protein
LVGPEGSKLDKVVIVTFEMKDVEAYNEFIPCVPSPHPLHPRVRC